MIPPISNAWFKTLTDFKLQKLNLSMHVEKPVKKPTYNLKNSNADRFKQSGRFESEEKPKKEPTCGLDLRTKERKNRRSLIRWLLGGKGVERRRSRGVVFDIVGLRGMCGVEMDDTREISAPRVGGWVVVLLGTYKGTFGNLIRNDMERETALVLHADTNEVSATCSITRTEVAYWNGSIGSNVSNELKIVPKRFLMTGPETSTPINETRKERTSNQNTTNQSVIKGYHSALRELLKEPSNSALNKPMLLNFNDKEIEEVVKKKTKEKVVTTNPKDKEKAVVADEDLSKLFKEVLKCPFTKRIIEFSAPVHRLPTNSKIYEGTGDLEDHITRFTGWEIKGSDLCQCGVGCSSRH
nr:hypothetical protein [Tanacetum cinerariifolium]